MNLKEIFKGIKYELIKGTMDEVIKDIAYDSRLVQNGTLFLANFGIKEDNSKYIPSAITNGAKVIVIGEDINILDDVTVIKTKYTINGEEGTIALIGPKRMEYDRVITLLNYIKENIGK